MNTDTKRWSKPPLPPPPPPPPPLHIDSEEKDEKKEKETTITFIESKDVTPSSTTTAPRAAAVAIWEEQALRDAMRSKDSEEKECWAEMPQLPAVGIFSGVRTRIRQWTRWRGSLPFCPETGILRVTTPGRYVFWASYSRPVESPVQVTSEAKQAVSTSLSFTLTLVCSNGKIARSCSQVSSTCGHVPSTTVCLMATLSSGDTVSVYMESSHPLCFTDAGNSRCTFRGYTI